jgi:phage/plasmid-associated DNA primase
MQTTISNSEITDPLIANVSIYHDQLIVFLRDHKIRLNNEITEYHVTANGGDFVGSKAHFGSAIDLENFFDLYDLAQRNGCHENILERTTDGPRGIMIDIDREQDDPNNSIFTQLVITQSAQLLAQTIHSMIHNEISTNINLLNTATDDDDDAAASINSSAAADQSFHIFVIQRTRITHKNANILSPYKDGIHLLVPEIWFDKSTRAALVVAFKRNFARVFTSGSITPEEARKMVDVNSAHVPTFLLGSHKPGGIRYALTYAANMSWPSGALVSRPLSIDVLNSGLTAPIDEGGHIINLSYELSLSFAFNQFRGESTWLHKGPREIIESARASIATLSARALTDGSSIEHVRQSYEDRLADLIGRDNHAAYVRDLLFAISEDWARDYSKWFNVLCALTHEGARLHMLDEYVLLGEMFSRRAADKWDAQVFARTWSQCAQRVTGHIAIRSAVTLRSLELAARVDNAALYDDARRHHAESYLRACIYRDHGNLSHNVIAEVLYLIAGTYIAIDPDAADIKIAREWFEFVTNETDQVRDCEMYKWRHTSEALALRRLIDTNIKTMVREILDHIAVEYARPGADADRTKTLKSYLKALNVGQRSLDSRPFISGIINLAISKFMRIDFVKNLDTDPYVIGVSNGILELAHLNEQHEYVFEPRLIQGIHPYLISKYMRVPYAPYDASCARVGEIMRAYSDIYIEPETRDFMLMYLSTWLDLCAAQRIIVLLGGGGSNGKTWSVLFPQTILGLDYVKVLRMQLLTESRENGRDANSALMQLKGLRGGYFDEANEGDALNSARIKTIVTPGVQTCRDLYTSEQQFRNTANTVAISNYEFVVNSSDQGTWDRIYYYVCKSRFVANPDPNIPHQHAANIQMTTEWPENVDYQRAMLSILVHYRTRLHNEYGDNMRAVPHTCIAQETARFREKQDPITRFVREHLAISPNSTENLKDVIDHYIAWYRRTMNVRITNVASLGTMFENSILREHVQTLADGREVIAGIRYRDRDGDRLSEDETLFAQ